MGRWTSNRLTLSAPNTRQLDLLPQTDGLFNDVTVDWATALRNSFQFGTIFNAISHEYPDDHAWYTITFTQGVCEQTATLLKSVSVIRPLRCLKSPPTGACAPATLTLSMHPPPLHPDTEFEWTFDDGTVSGVLDTSNAGALVDHYRGVQRTAPAGSDVAATNNARRQAAFGVQSVTMNYINIWDKDNPIIGASSLELVWPENTVDLQNVSEKVC